MPLLSLYFGVRFKDTKIPWKIVTKLAEKGKQPDVELKEHCCSKVEEEYDLFVMDDLYLEGASGMTLHRRTRRPTRWFHG